MSNLVSKQAVQLCLKKENLPVTGGR